MAKADIQPRWLVSLMCQWSRRELSQQDGGIGYPKKAAFLLVHSATAAHTDPTGESAKDFQELDDALEKCRDERFNPRPSLLTDEPSSIARFAAKAPVSIHVRHC